MTLTDAAVVVFATASTHTLWFGFSQVFVSTALTSDFGVDYVTFSVVLVVAWMLVLALGGTRDSRILGTDSTEYRRIINATLLLFGTIAVFAAMTQTDFARGYLATAFPLGHRCCCSPRAGRGGAGCTPSAGAASCRSACC